METENKMYKKFIHQSVNVSVQGRRGRGQIVQSSGRYRFWRERWRLRARCTHVQIQWFKKLIHQSVNISVLGRRRGQILRSSRRYIFWREMETGSQMYRQVGQKVCPLVCQCQCIGKKNGSDCEKQQLGWEVQILERDRQRARCTGRWIKKFIRLSMSVCREEDGVRL